MTVSGRGPVARGSPEHELCVDELGWVDRAQHIVSPNCDSRPQAMPVELAVIHGISLPPGEFGGAAVQQLFTNTLDYSAHPYYSGLRGLRVSAHFLIRRDGALLQFVPGSLRAWHAGDSCWRGRSRCNDFSIGIELEGADDRAYGDAQYAVCNALLRALCRRYPLSAVAGHCDIAPGRKTDPGPFFQWERIDALGRGA
jgi:AmpD protein